jgi:hypothetical protein
LTTLDNEVEKQLCTKEVKSVKDVKEVKKKSGSSVLLAQKNNGIR